YGRFSPVNKGRRELDLFIQHKGGEKIVDPEKQDALCSRLKLELLHPLRVLITNRGPDTELLVANPVELLSDEAEMEQQQNGNLTRFLLDENCNFQLSSKVVRNQIVEELEHHGGEFLSPSSSFLFNTISFHRKETFGCL
ncbi:ACT domain-containing protein ACR9, partial [Sesamum angolense]